MQAIFLFFHANTLDTFRSPVHFCGCSGDLLATGFSSRVIEVFLAPDREIRRRTLAELGARIRELAPEVTVLWEVPDENVHRVVREAARGHVIVADATARVPEGTVDIRVHHVRGNPGILTAVVQCLLTGEIPDLLPNVVAGPAVLDPEAQPSRMEPVGVPPLFHGDPDTDIEVIPAGFNRVSTRASILVNPGCPHGSRISGNPCFEGIDLPGEMEASRGCSFCSLGDRYLALDPPAAVDRITSEIRAWRAARPNLDEIVLWDQFPFAFLEPLCERLHREGMVPLTICIHGRPDYLVRFRHVLDRICALNEAKRGATLHLAVTLIGFENFSVVELDRMNKGLTPDDLGKAASTCRGLADRWPRVFSHDRYRASSFILFTPWTGMDDLRQNIAGIRREGLLEFATGMGLSKLRLYPDLPLYWKARQDGLLKSGYSDAALDGAGRFGYGLEHPWRFVHGATESVYRLYSRLYPLVDRSQQVDLLEWVIRRVESEPALDPDVVAAEFERLGQWHVRAESRMAKRDTGGSGRGKSHPGPRKGSIELMLGQACNLGCEPCLQTCAVLDPSPARLDVRLAEAGLNNDRLTLLGREPTSSPLFLQAVRTARARGFREVDVLTNGRMFAYARFLAEAVQAGLTSVRVKVFGATAASCESRTRTPGAFGQVMKGLANLGGAGSSIHTRCVLVVRDDSLGDLDAMHELASGKAAGSPGYLVPVSGLPVAPLGAFLDALDEHLDRIP
jgi:hypothetical protein